MYSPSDLVTAIQKPTVAARELNRLVHTRGGLHSTNPRGTNVLDEDWDNLIILDACRYDFFQEQTDFPGRLEKRQSVGASTPNFIRGTFSGRTCHDLVYVSANSWFLRLRETIGTEIHRFVNLRGEDYDVKWANEELGVIHPKSVTEYAEGFAERYPNKRLIVHYLQPHHPFIGPTGEKYFNHQSSSLVDVVAQTDASITGEVVRKAYSENLEIVAEEVDTVLNYLHGKTIITADHGEMLGDRHTYVPVRDYGHHEGIYNDSTVGVPWQIIEGDERRNHIEEQPRRTDDVDFDAINDQLRDLGYTV